MNFAMQRMRPCKSTYGKMEKCKSTYGAIISYFWGMVIQCVLGTINNFSCVILENSKGKNNKKN